ncbi:Ig-like domain-containing protein [Candidatus Peregrinibacteria bacterium]|nr:Ig-like domain-containing protein [Candidatus Peregrinibacteria bacterium]
MKKHLSILSLLAMSALVVNTGVALAQGEETPIPETKTVAEADATYPADVENVKAVAGDGMVTLSWDAGTDNVGVKGYKLFYGPNSVSTDGASYTMGPVDVQNVLTYQVKNLENGKAYYFAVTAYDAAGNESEFYSTEVSATPTAGGSPVIPSDDAVAPKVVSAAAQFKNLVKVTFSEAVKLPATTPEAAFSVKEDFLNTVLAVSKVEIDATDKSGKTVLLSTADQKKNAKYVLTVGIQVQDLAGNPMVSGTSDTAIFSGTDAAQEAVKPAAEEKPADTTAPAFVAVKSLDSSNVEVTFSEPIVLLADAVQNFIITDAADNTKIITVKKVSVAANGTKVTLLTDPMEAKKYNLIAVKIKDAAGNTMPTESSATSFDGMAPAVVETPTTGGKVEEAASDLVAKAMAQMMVNLSWKPNADKLAGMANFVVYMSADKGVTYGPGVVLGKDAKSYDFSNLKEDMVYYFKLTTRDAAGNESAGLITSLILPKTGPELAFLFMGSAGLGAWFTKKKKK